MRARIALVKDKRQIESVLLVCVLVATSMVVVFPLSAPKAKAQPPIEHRGSASAEDGISPFDTDGLVNNIVVWDENVDHWITDNYTVEAGYTLNIPALNYIADPDLTHEITFKTEGVRIDVWGTLITNMDSQPFTKTLFWGENVVNWTGIYFRSGSYGNIIDCMFMDAKRALMFFGPTPGIGPASTLLYPGIYASTFTHMGDFGVQLFGPSGYKHMEFCTFTDTYNSATGVDTDSSSFNIKNSSFNSHGNNKPSLRIRYSNVNVEQCNFMGNNQPGNEVYLGQESSGTVLSNCNFNGGAADDHYIQVNGSSPLIDNCSFNTGGGSLSVIAKEKTKGPPGHPIIRNPNPGKSFDNTTINAIDNSSVTLQWYMDVNVKDPNGNPIDNAPVWVKDRNGSPTEPPSKATNISGWAPWFIATELIQYNNSCTYYSPYNVSAENNSVLGYADPEPIMNTSKDVFVIVPFSLIPNIKPKVTWITTPVGVQSGLIPIQYRLEDPNPGDDGNLSVKVWFSTDNATWLPAIQGGGDPTTKLYNDTVYTFIWDSTTKALQGMYNTTVYIKIIPYDRAESGTPNQTGNFTVDNEAPKLLSGPVVTATNTTALIQWTVHEPADAAVWYGFTLTSPVFTTETSGSTGTALQTVTLTNLQPGRNYTFIINSTDPFGHKFSSYPNNFTFETEVHIQLYAGWNMISIPPMFPEQGSFPWVSVVLASIVNDWDIVEWYDASDTKDPWKINCTYKPFGNDLHEIYANMGLWIHMLTDTVLIPPHWDPTADPMTPDTTPIDLYEGWNFVGYPSVETRLTTEALSGVPYDMVKTYDAVTMKWLSYDGSSGDLTEMEMGRGYWIHATADHTWLVDYV